MLQLTRFALVFTAISNATASLLLRAAHEAEISTRAVMGEETARVLADGTVEVMGSLEMVGATGGVSGEAEALGWASVLSVRALIWTVVVSGGLYGFGMSLNDIIDRRRDAQLAADRPLPSGRIGLWTAHVICGLMLVIAGVGAWRLSVHLGDDHVALVLAGVVAILIAGYDLAGKYLVAFGLVLLGVIRFLHASIPAPGLPMVWHPLLLLNHVTVLSAICYAMERKRPLLTRRHVLMTAGILLLANASVFAWLVFKRGDGALPSLAELGFGERLFGPAVAVAVFAVIAAVMIRRGTSSYVGPGDPRSPGRGLMLLGLLWLIVYDAAFVMTHVDVWVGIALAGLLPTAWLSVKLMRGFSRMIELSERPNYIRGEM
jgi:4-hydroxybenzoate polyprenyltransferase